MNGLLSGLELLAAVAETRSFVRAGERVGLSQSGVSRAIARLEERIGVRLFDRNARAVTLTDEGRRFHESVVPLVSAIEDAVDATHGSQALVRGRLRVNVDPLFGRSILGPHIQALLDLHPELEIDLVVRDHADDFVAEGFDVAVRFGEPDEPSLVGRLLLRTRIVTCASPAYIARKGRPRRPQDLAKGHDCILFRDPRTGRPFDWEFHRRGRILKVDVHGPFHVNDGATAVEACVGGHGIAQLMELTTEEHFRSGALVALFPSWKEELFPLYILHPSKRLPPAKVRAFVDFIVAMTRELVRR
jgi:DNA-binding transcriptional LysR family regulator